MRISVGIPIYDGNVQFQSVLALLAETRLASEQGHKLTVRFLPGCCNLAKGRNQLVKEFLASDDERLVFLDGDVTFQPGDLLKIAKHPVDFVGGCYRYKRPNENYPVGWLGGGELWADENGLLEVAMIPTGFLSLSRKVFDRFREKHPNREYVIEGNRTYCYFQIPYRDGHLYTEDAYFCREWRELGGKIFLDPDLLLVHWDGKIPYIGHIGNFCRNQADIQAKAKALNEKGTTQ